ncbi:MAG: zinc-binding dehydrogenase [Acidimicrobiales bacterium]|nr:zinc-binding dehydrogenase [Acidimicrobiales bacterium]
MRAVTLVDGRVEVRDHPDPEPGAGELLIRIRSAGLNNADLAQRAGMYPAPSGSPQDIPGLELAGEVAAVGPQVFRYSVGDRVMAIVGGGGQASLAVLHERVAIPVPEGLSWGEAGGFPEAYFTSYDALFSQCNLSVGERLLVTGAAGGVGVAAVQLGVAAGARVVASVRDPARRDDVAAFGAEVVAPDDHLAHGPYDVVLEMFPKHNLATDVEALATGGRIHIVSSVGGTRAEFNVSGLMRVRGRIHGSSLRSRPLEAKASVSRAVESHVLPLLGAGRVTVPVCATFGLEEAGQAYERFVAGHKLGKIVLEP